MLDSNECIFTSVIPLRSLPLGEPKEPGRYDDQEEEEDEESEQDESISPPRVLVPDIQPDEDVLSDSVLAVPTTLALPRYPPKTGTNSFAQAPHI